MKTFWTNPGYWLLGRGEPEADNSAGWGPFRLPKECAWMQRAARQHDARYRESATQTMRRSEADAELFRNWCRAADAAFDSIERCKRYLQICKYFPYVRDFGGFFWDEERKVWVGEHGQTYGNGEFKLGAA